MIGKILLISFLVLLVADISVTIYEKKFKKRRNLDDAESSDTGL